MGWQQIRRCIGRWIALAIWENDSGIPGKAFAVVYKFLFATAIYLLYFANSEDNLKQLFYEKFCSVFRITLKDDAYKQLVLVICFLGFSLLLEITYWVAKWEKKVACMKRFLSGAQVNVWKQNRRIRYAIHEGVKSYVLPCVWPFFCSFVGIEGSVITLGLLHLSYLAFIFRHRYVEGFRFTNTFVAAAVYIIHSPLGNKSEKGLYMVLINVVVPLCIRSGLIHMLKWEDDALGDGLFRRREWEERRMIDRWAE